MSHDIFGLKDPFNLIGLDSGDIEQETYKLHLRVQQRNARQRITTLAGLPNTYDFKTLVRSIKKKFCCGGVIIDDPGAVDDRFSKVLQFSGDQRKSIAGYLVAQKIAEQRDITIHGY